MPSHHDDEPFEREDILTRKARRLEELEEERRDYRVTAVIGLVMLGMAAGLGWYTRATLLRGSMDLDDGPSIVRAAEEPAFFYGMVAVMAAIGLFCAGLGVRMLLHARREARRTERLGHRLRGVGRAGGSAGRG